MGIKFATSALPGPLSQHTRKCWNLSPSIASGRTRLLESALFFLFLEVQDEDAQKAESMFISSWCPRLELEHSFVKSGLTLCRGNLRWWLATSSNIVPLKWNPCWWWSYWWTLCQLKARDAVFKFALMGSVFMASYQWETQMCAWILMTKWQPWLAGQLFWCKHQKSPPPPRVHFHGIYVLPEPVSVHNRP